MTKNKIPTLLPFMVLLLLLVGTATAIIPEVTPEVTTPGVLYVDDVEDDSGGNFSTIQEAVNAADETNKTILVYPGTYEENVEVNKELTIKSVSGNPEDTILNASGSDHAFDVSANNVTISGFEINIPANSSIAAIKISGQNNTIFDNTITGNNNSTGYGIYIYRSDGNELRNNTISECGYKGLSLYYSDENELSNNTISDSAFKEELFLP